MGNLKFIEKQDKKYDFTYKNYLLRQGDSFTLTATERNGSEEDVAIEKLVFKLGLNETECKINPIFEQDYVRDVNGVWVLMVASGDTAKWKPTCACDDEPYVYEIEMHLVDGQQITLTSGEFKVEPQIGGSV